MLLISSVYNNGKYVFCENINEIELIWLYDKYNVRKFGNNNICNGISMNLFADKSKCFNDLYLFNELFLLEPNEHILLFLHSILYKVSIIPKLKGNPYKIFLFMIINFNDFNFPIY